MSEPIAPVRQLLLVDGHADTAESLQLLLEFLGYRVQVALDGARAIELATRNAFDLGFIAINLSDIDGYTLAGRLRAGGNPRILVALTGHGFTKDRERAIEAGFDAHVLKPATVDQLEIVLTRFLGSQPG